MQTSMLALQGPNALELLDRLVEGDAIREVKYYRSTFVDAFGLPNVRVSRTGYTGENGFELYLPRDEGPRIWKHLLEEGRDAGLEPIGLGARDTLRLEAGMPLYGHEIDAEHDPISADLEFGIALTPEKGDFVGRGALERFKAERTHTVVGLTTPGPRVPRQGQTVLDGRTAVGTIASGAKSPTLGTNIATAHVPLTHAELGRELSVDFRGKTQDLHGRRAPLLLQDAQEEEVVLTSPALPLSSSASLWLGLLARPPDSAHLIRPRSNRPNPIQPPTIDAPFRP